MARFASTKNLLRVSKAKKNDIDRWKEGRSLQTDTGRTLEELYERAVADRLDLAFRFLRVGVRLLKGSKPEYRLAVGRLYYSMYHAMRAAVYFSYGGDDHEEHRTLPAKAPDDLPGGAILSNSLKDARERRNAADYNPYPKSDLAWKANAEVLAADAKRLLQEVRQYLLSKGCRYI